MSLPSYLRSVAAKFFHRSLLADEMEEELRSHIQHRADDLERSGMPRAEAERRARIEFGNRDKFRQESYEALGGNFIESILQDIRLGVRVLRKSPGFTLTAIITLALAIGANSVVFSVLDALVLRPVNVPHGKNLCMIQQGWLSLAVLSRLPRPSRPKPRLQEHGSLFHGPRRAERER